MEDMALCMLGKHSVIGAGPPALPYIYTPFLCVGIPYHISERGCCVGEGEAEPLFCLLLASQTITYLLPSSCENWNFLL